MTSHIIEKVEIPPNMPRYFGLVCFSLVEEARKAAESLNGNAVEGITWYVVPHIKRDVRKKQLENEYKKRIEEYKKRNLFIKNLPIYMNESMLEQICVEYGEIESIKINMAQNVTYKDNYMIKHFESTGSAFVCYVNENSARKALLGLRKKMIDSNRIFVVMWKPRDELVNTIFLKKKQMMQTQMMNFGMLNPMFQQQSKPGRGRAVLPQMIPQMMPQIIRPMIQPMVRQMPPEINKLNIDLNNFYASNQETQRRILGEQFYPIVLKNSNEKVAGKITGMLLEIEPRVLINLLQNPVEIVNKVKEAVEVLRKAWAQNPEYLATLP